MIVFILGGCAAANAGDVTPITKMESRQLPADVVTRRVLSQLSDVLHLEQIPSTGPKPHLPLSDLEFWTTPRATYAPELCAADQLTVSFRPIAAKTAGADTKTVAQGVSASTYYHFLHTPVSPTFEAMKWPDILATRSRCATVDPLKDRMFLAPNEGNAVEGMWLVAQFARGLSSASPPFALDCVDYRENKVQCLSDAKQMAPELVTGIGRCKSGEDRTDCWEISGDGPGIVRLFVRMKDSEPNIVRVRPMEEITIADLKED